SGPTARWCWSASRAPASRRSSTPCSAARRSPRAPSAPATPRDATPPAPTPPRAFRGADAKGRHTPPARHLVALPGGGALIDTPGVRELGLWGSEEGVRATFADIAALAEGCPFADC